MVVFFEDDPSAPLAHLKASVGSIAIESIISIYDLKYYTLACTALLYYDWLLTLPLEIRRVWASKFTFGTYLFFLNRYISIFVYVPIVISLYNPLWTSHQSVAMISINTRYADRIHPYPWRRCSQFAPVIGFITTFNQFVIAIILILRTYALYQRKTIILILTCVFAVVQVSVSGWAASFVSGTLFSFPPLKVCLPSLDQSKKGLKFAWTSSLAFDFLIFVLTFARTGWLLRARNTGSARQSPLVTLIMRDGGLYFLVMCAVNIANFIYFTKANVSLTAQTTGSNSLLFNTVSVTLISRLLLNLRSESHRTSSSRRLTNSHGHNHDTTLSDPSNSTFGSRWWPRTNNNWDNSNHIFSTRILTDLADELGADWVEDTWGSEDVSSGYISARSRATSSSGAGTSSGARKRWGGDPEETGGLNAHSSSATTSFASASGSRTGTTRSRSRSGTLGERLSVFSGSGIIGSSGGWSSRNLSLDAEVAMELEEMGGKGRGPTSQSDAQYLSRKIVPGLTLDSDLQQLAQAHVQRWPQPMRITPPDEFDERADPKGKGKSKREPTPGPSPADLYDAQDDERYELDEPPNSAVAMLSSPTSVQSGSDNRFGTFGRH